MHRLHTNVGRSVRLCWVLMSLLALCLILTVAAAPQKKSSKEFKLSELHQDLLERSKQSPVVNITAAEYQQFFSGKGSSKSSTTSVRTPHILLLITMMDQKTCPICVYMYERFLELQKGYSLDHDSKGMLFLLLEYNRQTKHIPINLGLQSLPAVVVFKGFNQEKPAQICNPAEQDILQCISQSTGKKMRFHSIPNFRRFSRQQDPPPEPSILTNHLLTVICFGSSFAIYVILTAMFSPKALKRLAMFISMCAYFLFFGGTTFNILDNSPLYKTDRSGRLYFVAPSLRDQFVLEGYLASFTVFSFALAFVFLHKLIQSAVQTPVSEQEQEDRQSKESKPEEKEETQQSSKFPFFSVFLPMLTIMAISFCFLHIMYLVKHPYYLDGTFLRSMLHIPSRIRL